MVRQCSSSLLSWQLSWPLHRKLLSTQRPFLHLKRASEHTNGLPVQFSSSLPSGQSLKPLQRKRPMMQWMPLAQAKNVGAHLDLILGQPFSSLLSKQSGNPSHCHPPGTHLPSPHMKFPGMLHSVVKLFPGSSWLSTVLEPDPEPSNRYQIHIIRSPFPPGLPFLSCPAAGPKTGGRDEKLIRYTPVYTSFQVSTVLFFVFRKN